MGIYKFSICHCPDFSRYFLQQPISWAYRNFSTSTARIFLKISHRQHFLGHIQFFLLPLPRNLLTSPKRYKIMGSVENYAPHCPKSYKKRSYQPRVFAGKQIILQETPSNYYTTNLSEESPLPPSLRDDDSQPGQELYQDSCL